MAPLIIMVYPLLLPDLTCMPATAKDISFLIVNAPNKKYPSLSTMHQFEVVVTGRISVIILSCFFAKLLFNITKSLSINKYISHYISYLQTVEALIIHLDQVFVCFCIYHGCVNPDVT